MLKVYTQEHSQVKHGEYTLRIHLLQDIQVVSTTHTIKTGLQNTLSLLHTEYPKEKICQSQNIEHLQNFVLSAKSSYKKCLHLKGDFSCLLFAKCIDSFFFYILHVTEASAVISLYARKLHNYLLSIHRIKNENSLCFTKIRRHVYINRFLKIGSAIPSHTFA